MNENYRRPPRPVRVASREVEGFIPKQTANTAGPAQPYRARVLQQWPSRPIVRPAPLVVKQQPAVITPVQSVPQPAPVMQSAPATQIQKPRPVRQKTLLDMALPEGSSINRHHMSPRIRKQVKNARTMVMRSAFAMSTMVIVVGGVLFSQGLLNVNKVFKGTAQHAAALDEDVDVNKLKGEGDGRINVLLTGIGGEKHAGGDLTDTLMLASIDPVNNTAALLSVPRDMWVTIPGKGSMKINAAYATAKYEYMRKNKVPATDTGANTAGFTAIDQTMEQVLGVPIHYNLLVNFQAFRQSIDTVGGITINVPEDLYDPTMAWENNRDPYLARAGSQDFDGKRALMYARSRETSSDFARGERQRAVLLALKEKTISAGILANPTKLNGLLSAFGNNVQTDLSISDANRLYSIMKRINNSNITSVSLAGTTSTTSSGAGDDTLITTGNINGQSIVQPLAGLENYDDIQEYVRSKLQDGYITKEKARVLVVNGTVESGLAQRTADKLKSYGYNVIGTATTQTDVYPDTVVVDRTNGKSKYTKNYLEQRYNVKATKILKDTSITPGTADFVVILGSDSTD